MRYRVLVQTEQGAVLLCSRRHVRGKHSCPAWGKAFPCTAKPAARSLQLRVAPRRTDGRQIARIVHRTTPSALLVDAAPAPQDEVAVVDLPASPRLGITLQTEDESSSTSFRVWAPHAVAATVQLKDGPKIPLSQEGDTWAARVGPGV